MAAPYYERHGVTVLAGNCLDVLPGIEDASVDAVVTDPPYELAFMGRAWDASGIAYSVEMWRECFRVLKPGGHLLAFGGTRTFHRVASAVEDAGFNLRDTITWLYGSGFPKSLDVSKAIDKARDDKPEARAVGAWYDSARQRAGFSHAQVCAHGGWHGGTNHGGASVNWAKGHNVPTWEQWLQLRDLIGFGDEMDADVWRLNGRKGTWGNERTDRVVGEMVKRDVFGATGNVEHAGTPVLDDAARWQGWGTALKPAQEPIIVARKPLSGTVAATVLAHGTGALNIDGCRTDNRWPSNVVLTHDLGCDEEGRCAPDCPVSELDQQSGVTTSGSRQAGDHVLMGYMGAGASPMPAIAGDSGGASRFFPAFRWEAKAPTSERPQVDGISHPTVKPIDLMRWLVRLVTPPGGLILDPFAGSGTTLHAARAEGFRAVGIEREPDYLRLIAARLDARPRAAEVAPPVPADEPMDLLDLLGGEVA